MADRFRSMSEFDPAELNSDELVEMIALASRELARRIHATPSAQLPAEMQGLERLPDDSTGDLEIILKRFERARRLVDEERLLVELRELDAAVRCIEKTELSSSLGDEIESVFICVEDMEDLKKRVPRISTPDDWNAANDSLQHLRKQLDGFAVQSLVDHLIDELKSNWPTVAPDRQVFDPKRGRALERARHYQCKNDKPMVLRTSKAKGTTFWGCSEFPTCCFTRRWLTKEESNYLFSESEDLPGE